MRSPYEQLRAARAQTRRLRRMLGYAGEVTSGLVALSGLVRPTQLSSLNGPIGPHRRYAWATTSVDDIKQVRTELGGSFNDVVLASITNGFRELLLARGEDIERVVRTLVPVSVRPRDQHGKAVGDGTFENKVSAMFAELPVDIEDPVLRLHVITDQMKDLKESKQAVAGEALTSMSGFAPPMLLALGMRLATRAAQRNVNTVTTNVPGPQFPLYAAGRRMVRAFPYVPLGGQIRIGIAIFSYDGEVNFGVTGDYDTTDGHRRPDQRHRGRHGADAQGLRLTVRPYRDGMSATSASRYLRSPETMTFSTVPPTMGTCTFRSPSTATTVLCVRRPGPGAGAGPEPVVTARRQAVGVVVGQDDPRCASPRRERPRSG